VRTAPQQTRTYFVTAVTAQRRSLFQVTSAAELLQQTILDYRGQGKFLLHAFVLMPDHFHAIITPAPNISLEKTMQFIKGASPSASKVRSMSGNAASTKAKFQPKRNLSIVCAISRTIPSGAAWHPRPRIIPSAPPPAARWIPCPPTCDELNPGPKGRASSLQSGT
jgi:putative transposase